MIEQTPSPIPEHLIILATTYQVRLRRFKSNDQETARKLFDLACQSLNDAASRLSTAFQTRIYEAGHLLYPPKGSIVSKGDLTKSIRTLRQVIEGGCRLPSVLQLWIRAQIRVVYKRRDGELQDGKAWWSPLEDGASILLKTDRDMGPYQQPHRVRLFLRLLRKRAELEAPPFESQAKIVDIIENCADLLGDVQPSLLRSILIECTHAIGRGDLAGDRLVQLFFYELSSGALQGWRALIAARFLFEVVGGRPVGGVSRRDVLLAIDGFSDLEFDRMGGILKQRVRFEIVEEAIEQLLSAEGSQRIDEVLVVIEKFFRSATERVVVQEFCKRRMADVENYFGAMDEGEHFALLLGLERQFFVHCPFDLRFYRDALRFKVLNYSSRLIADLLSRTRRDLELVDACLSVDAEIGSLFYSGSNLLGGDRWQQGARLIFEARAKSLHRQEDSDFFRALQVVFSRQLFQRVVRSNFRTVDQKVVQVHLSDETILGLGSIDDEWPLRMLLELPKVPLLPGVICVAQLIEGRSPHAEAEAVFSAMGGTVSVKCHIPEGGRAVS